MELDCVDSIGKVLKVVFKYQLVLRPGGRGDMYRVVHTGDISETTTEGMDVLLL